MIAGDVMEMAGATACVCKPYSEGLSVINIQLAIVNHHMYNQELPSNEIINKINFI